MGFGAGEVHHGGPLAFEEVETALEPAGVVGPQSQRNNIASSIASIDSIWSSLNMSPTTASAPSDMTGADTPARAGDEGVASSQSVGHGCAPQVSSKR